MLRLPVSIALFLIFGLALTACGEAPAPPTSPQVSLSTPSKLEVAAVAPPTPWQIPLDACLPRGSALIALGGAQLTLGGETGITGDVHLDAKSAVNTTGDLSISGVILQAQDVEITQTAEASIGGIERDDEELATRMSDLSASLAAAAPTQEVDTTFPVSGILEIQGTGGINVIRFGADIRLLNQNSITLAGSKSDIFVLNFEKSLELSGQSEINLSGEIDPSHVILNLVGEGAPVILSGQNHIDGTILALRRTVLNSGQAEIAGALVIGRSLISSGRSLSVSEKGFCLAAPVSSTPIPSPPQ